MGGIFGKDTPLIRLSCINVRDTGDVNITRVDGKGKEKEEEKIEKFFCFRIRKKKLHGRREEKNLFEERRDRQASKSVRGKKKKKT